MSFVKLVVIEENPSLGWDKKQKISRDKYAIDMDVENSIDLEGKPFHGSFSSDPLEIKVALSLWNKDFETITFSISISISLAIS